MRRLDIERQMAQVPLAPGYRLELLERGQIDALIAFVHQWYPDIGVGGASGLLRRSYYEHSVRLGDDDDRDERDVLVLLLRHGETLAGMFSCEFDRERLSAYAGVGIAAGAHRGAGLVQAGLAFTEAMGRSLGMGLAYGMATLKAPHAQRGFERAGWRLIGITPGYDRELVAPGVVKRVFEAVYVKVLVDDSALLWPQRGNLTPRALAMFDCMFESETACRRAAA
jgi:hypothetical protein